MSDANLFGIQSPNEIALERKVETLEKQLRLVTDALCEKGIHVFDKVVGTVLPEGTLYCIGCGLLEEPLVVDWDEAPVVESPHEG